MHVDAIDLGAQLARQLAHPGGEVGRRVRLRVVVHELREVVVALVGVAAAAVLVAAADRDVVVARDRHGAHLRQQRPDRVALRAEAAEVPEAVERVTSTRA